MKVKASQLPTDVLKSIENPDPLQGEDIIIERDNGEIVGVIIQPEAYNFFIKKNDFKKVEEIIGHLEKLSFSPIRRL